MPIYEYECTQCGNVHEIMQKISDKPLSKCPQCAGKLQKMISHSTFHLKGSGWYVTDYANKSGAASDPVKKKKNDATDSSSKTTDIAKTSASE